MSMSPNNCSCCWGDNTQIMIILGFLKVWIIDKSGKDNHWGHSVEHLTLEVTWAHLDAHDEITESQLQHNKTYALQQGKKDF